MTGKEYLTILKENQWQRSSLVRIMEDCVAVFEKNGLHEQAEQTKWHIFEIAEMEKEKGELM